MASAEFLTVVENADLTRCIRPQPPLALETISSSSHHQAKRRKVSRDAEDESDADYDLEGESDDDCGGKEADSEEEEEEDRLSTVHGRTQSAIEVDSVNERLSALQHLLPHGLELEEDEILKVAVEYVRELEREIQMFDTSTDNHCWLNHGISDAPLQKRGLCIVPLSALAKAL